MKDVGFTGFYVGFPTEFRDEKWHNAGRRKEREHTTPSTKRKRRFEK
jgi:hypothetical protein